MENKLLLKRRPIIEIYRLTGRVSKAEERNELYPILLLAEDDRKISAQKVSGHLLGSRLSVAKRLIDICERYELLEPVDKHFFKLTPKGMEAIKSKRVFVPQFGTWTIWVSQDPLFSDPVLHMEPYSESSASEEIFGSQENKRRDFTDIPSWIKRATGKEMQSIAGKRNYFILNEIEGDKCERIDSLEAHLNLSIEISINGARVGCEGKINKDKVLCRYYRTDIDFPKAWKKLLQNEGLWERWDQIHKLIRQDFEKTNASERMSMTMDLELPAPRLPDLGRFNPATVHKIPVAAMSADDATPWGIWRLKQKIQHYADKDQYDDWVHEAKRPFEEFSIHLPSRREFIHLLETDRTNSEENVEKLWFLRAMEDWNL